MHQQHDIIRRGLQELSNATQSGQNWCVTFEANGREHWLRCTPTHIIMDWPFSSPPAESDSLKQCFGFGGPIHIEDWGVDSHVTFTPTARDVEELIDGIARTFRVQYGLGAGYTLTFKLEHA